MKRRAAIGVLSGCVAWSFAIRAQQPALPVIGFLDTASPGPLAHFLEGSSALVAHGLQSQLLML